MIKKENKSNIGNAFILGGLLLLFQQTFYNFTIHSSIDVFWWGGLVLIIVGSCLHPNLIQLEFCKYWKRKYFILAIALMLESMMIYFFFEFMMEIETMQRIKLFLTIIILFFCTLYMRENPQKI